MQDVQTTLATGAILAAIYNMIQPLIDPLLPKAQAQHDALTRILVVLIGAIVGIVQYLLLATTVVSHDLAQAALSGCAEGLAAIATYHLAGDNLPAGEKAQKRVGGPVKEPAALSDTKGAIPLPGSDMSQGTPPTD